MSHQGKRQPTTGPVLGRAPSSAGGRRAAPTCSSVRPDSSRLSREGTACTASSVEAGAKRWASAAELKEVAPEARDIDTDRASSEGVGVAEPLWAPRALRGRASPASAFSGVRG